MYTHKVTVSMTTPGGQVAGSESVYIAGRENNLDEDIPISTDLAVAFACIVAKVKTFFIKADQNMTVKTNSSGSPANTLTLIANKPYLWHSDSLDTFKLTVNVTGLFITNTVAGKLTIACLEDPT